MSKEKETPNRGFKGDGITRPCGAVGHDCDECYIKCDLNPMTIEEDDERYLMELEALEGIYER